MAKKVTAPSVGTVYADRDARKNGRRVKVVKLLRNERLALCENVASGKQTRISYEVLAGRFDRVS